MSRRVRDHVAPALADPGDTLNGERQALTSYLDFVVHNKQVYRIIDEAEFVDPEGFRHHYESTAARIASRLQSGMDKGELRQCDALENEVRAWAMMGINVFLGLRFGVWGGEDGEQVAAAASDMLSRGLRP